MNQTAPKLRDFAGSLIAHDTAVSGSTEPEGAAAFHVIEQLGPHLANLMGKGGFRALLARALALASAEASWLDAVKVNADGTFDGLEVSPQIGPAGFLEGRVVLLAHLLGLLLALIGPDLTARLVKDIWPELHLTISISARGAP